MIEPYPSLPVVLTGCTPAARIDPRTNLHTRTSLQTIMRQLNKSLTVLASAADMLIQGRRGGAVSQSLLIWLQPNARQAEDALRRLREYQLTGSPAATELIQCLTVLVLAADMIVQGQLRDDTSPETYKLLRRNADRALKSLEELKKEVLM
ncbi:MAG: hypothetical protein ACUVSW_03590 [Roseiflexus sp.]